MMFENLNLILHDRCQIDLDLPVLVGVSGGPDSLCLLQVFYEAGIPVIAAHFNHQLRPEASAEADEVCDKAAHLNIPFVISTADVRQYSIDEKLSLEEAARKLRYHFLFAQARQNNAQAVAVGHTADDQVETVLMHLVRGSGLNGLRGMGYRTTLPTFDLEIPIIRPLLEVWREQVLSYCDAHNLSPRFDASNDSTDFFRNRVRHELIPILETYNPRFREAILRSVNILSADYAFMNEGLESAWNECILEETDGYVALNLNLLRNYSIAKLRNLIRRALSGLNAAQETNFDVLDRAAVFIKDHSTKSIDLIGGFTLRREGSTMYIVKPSAALPSRDWPQMPVGADMLPVSVPGKIPLAGGWEFSLEKYRQLGRARDESIHNQNRFEAWLDGDHLPGTLELRVSRSGDSLSPLGMDGHRQKLSDFFTNEKLLQRARERWPLLCFNETVIWVPGFRLSESFKLTERTENVLKVEVRYSKTPLNEKHIPHD